MLVALAEDNPAFITAMLAVSGVVALILLLLLSIPLLYPGKQMKSHTRSLKA